MNNFVAERLLPCQERKVSFRDPLSENKALTFSCVFEVGHTQSGFAKETAIKADRKVLHTLISAYEAGRNVNLSEVMIMNYCQCHKLLLNVVKFRVM